MKVDDFNRLANLADLSEIARVEKLAFFFAESKDQAEFTISEMTSLLVALGYASPNASRLKKNIQKSRSFVRGSSKDVFRISVHRKTALAAEFPDLAVTEEIISDDTLLPEILFQETRRGYLVRIAQQINATYENNLFDACALMMRRLLEILLLHSFEHCGIGAEVLDSDGGYLNLKSLINKAKSRPEIALSPNVRKSIDDFRELGNLSAHKIQYNCRRDDIRPLRMEYRAVIEELIYKAGIKPKGS